jgi:hypothetical protein
MNTIDNIIKSVKVGMDRYELRNITGHASLVNAETQTHQIEWQNNAVRVVCTVQADTAVLEVFRINTFGMNEQRVFHSVGTIDDDRSMSYNIIRPFLLQDLAIYWSADAFDVVDGRMYIKV